MSEPTNRIALKQRREQAIALLGQRFAEDLIDEDELEQRLEAAANADTLEQLDALTIDLVDPNDRALVAGSVESTAAAHHPTTALVPAGQVKDHDRSVALFGEVKQTGAWTPPRILTTVTAFGDTDLDFREARLGPGVTEVELQTVLGDVDIIVPPGLPVEISCSSILASLKTDESIHHVEPGDGPRLRITGFAVLADVEVQQRLPGETKREAKKRKKQERKALKRAQKQRALSD
jgi:hypothetical protein